MIDLFFEHSRRIALVRFSGDLTVDDLVRLGAVGHHFTKNEAPVGRILDFTAVDSVQVKTSVIASLGMVKSEKGDRIYVVPNPELFGLARLYSSYQQHGGENSEPSLVATFGEACAIFGLDAPDFRPYSPSA